ncbi:MAG: flagellar hook assembly protein FlgD [Cellulosilyticaceae bacterium]
MSNVNMVAPGSSSLQLDKTPKGPNQELDKDMFMQLMLTQLQYQDPMNPMDNQEMLAQLAQFTALEQMKNVADVAQKQYAQGMIGDYVSYSYKDEQTGKMDYLVGKVDYIKHQGSDLLIGIGEHEVKLENILEIYDSSNIQGNASAFELIGQTVQAVIQAEGQTPGIKENTIIEGEVLKVHMKDEKPYVVIGTGDKKVEVALEDVQNIVEKPSLTNKYITATMTDKEGNEVEIEGKVEYIVMQKESTYLYVNGQFVRFEDIKTVQDQKPIETARQKKYSY